ncbi:TonB-dependent receptor [Sphingobium xenophagum]
MSKNTNYSTKYLLASSVFAVSALAPTNALAQVKDGAETNGIEELVVTASRREERLQSVPQSISVVTPDQLTTANVVDTRQIASLSPSVKYQAGSLTTTQVLTMRGVGTFASGIGLQTSVGVAQDGVTAARIAASTPDLVDIERVEVLMGPQGLLFGKNSAAGLINVITKKPSREFEAIGRMVAGSMGERQMSVVGNVPVGESMSLRAVMWNNQNDGFIDTINQPGADRGNRNSSGARLAASWAPSDKFDIHVSGQWTKQNDDGAASAIVTFVPGNFTAANRGAEIYANELAQGIMPSFFNRTVSNEAHQFHRARNDLYRIDANCHCVGSDTLTFSASQGDTFYEDVFDPLNINSNYGAKIGTSIDRDKTKFTQRTYELRLASPSDRPIRYLIGVYADTLKIDNEFEIDVFGNVPTSARLLANTKMNSHSEAIFGQATWAVTDSFRITGGARYTWDEIDAHVIRNPVGTPAVIIPGFNSPGTTFGALDASGKVSNRAWSGRASLDYDLAPGTMVYAAYARGYKAAGTLIAPTVTASTLSLTGGIVNPEYSTLYEAGIKGSFFGHRLVINAAVFQETFKDFQVSLRLPTVTPAFAVQNAAEAQSTGVELSAAARIGQGLTLNFAGSYVHARFTDFKNASCFAGQTAAQGCVGGQQDATGNQLPNAPKFNVTASLNYERPVMDNVAVFFGTSIFHQSKVLYDLANDPRQVQSGYETVNASIGFKTLDDRAKVTFYVRNLFDKYYLDRIALASSGINYLGFPSYGSFRTFAVGLDLSF